MLEMQRENAGYLARLNVEQRRAVEHGGAALLEAAPLLIIAGAGSGKTNTLAHRVAHLIVGGVDPRRIMLLTFSRRAANEMQRRVERITAQVLGPRAGVMTDALSWSGTFHAIGARLLREYALDIGLNNAFTIHDREDSADLMNLVRHELGFSKTQKRFPMKGTCLAIYSRAVNAEAALGEVLGRFFPWCAEWEGELRALFGAYVEAKQKQNVLDYDDLLLYWAQMMVEGAIALDIAARFDHIMVDEYQDTNRLQASIPPSPSTTARTRRTCSTSSAMSWASPKPGRASPPRAPASPSTRAPSTPPSRWTRRRSSSLHSAHHGNCLPSTWSSGSAALTARE